MVNLAGLTGEAAKQAFVGRLLMAVFGHVQRHPAAPDQALVGLLVMDEAHAFAPSVRTTPSKQATLALVRQVRKYGLGMMFATQQPKDIDSGITGNCTTQFFGRANSQTAMDTIREAMARAGGGREDVGRLQRGEFFLKTEGLARPEKLRTPLCLTWHPASPPDQAGVIDRAARTRASP